MGHFVHRHPTWSPICFFRLLISLFLCSCSYTVPSAQKSFQIPIGISVVVSGLRDLAVLKASITSRKPTELSNNGSRNPIRPGQARKRFLRAENRQSYPSSALTSPKTKKANEYSCQLPKLNHQVCVPLSPSNCHERTARASSGRKVPCGSRMSSLEETPSKLAK